MADSQSHKRDPKPSGEAGRSSWAKGWGSWHTGPEAKRPCPQGDGNHTVEEAVERNLTESDARRAALRLAHERWLGKENGAAPKDDPV